MTKKQEIWRKIGDYPNYEVSNQGRVRNIKTGRVLRLGRDGDGYQLIKLYRGGKPKRFKVHRLVAIAFIENPYNKKEVNHISGDKTDNRVENLEWSTRSENMKHAYHTGLNQNIQRCHCIETNQIFESQCDAAICFGCHQSSISQSIRKGCKVKRKYHFELV